MLTQYKNNIDTNNLTQPISGQRINDIDLSLLSYVKNGRVAFDSNIFTGDNFRTELHIYAADTWITGNHSVNSKTTNLTRVTDPVTNEERALKSSVLEIDLYTEFEKLKLTRGEFTYVLNFFKNILGSYENQYVRISEISPDRTEVKLQLLSVTSAALQDVTNFLNVTEQSKSESGRFYQFLLNFSRNKTVPIVNTYVTGYNGVTEIFLKLYEPLDDTIEENFKCWIVQEDKLPFIDQVTIKTDVTVNAPNVTRLSGPNWEANTKLYSSAETNLKNWNDLLGSSVQTSQQIIDAYFSGSIVADDLNIDFTDFNNFVFYGSATERVKNFKYKIELLEYYSTQKSLSEQISGSVAVINTAQYQTNIDNLIGGFDAFERFLYYESSSIYFTHDIPLENANVPFITGSYIQPWPKTNSTKPYELASVASSEVDTWYTELLENANTYDTRNLNSLQKTIPEYIRLNDDNESLDTFVAMLGHHYDILYTYINHMSRMHRRDEHPTRSMPDKLLYSVAKQFGWTLSEGNQYSELWEYVLGTNEAGTPLTGSNSVGEPAVSGRKMTAHVWRRIVNNLPLLLKSKGTKRSVKALLACYGIPESLISINEYGGPRIDRAPVYEKLNFDYALDLITNTAGTVTVDYAEPINSVELRFRTDNVVTNPTIPSTMNLFTVGSNTVTVDFSSGTLGTLEINGTATDTIECFNGDWLTVLLRSGSAGQLELVAKKSKYGKIVAAVSASVTGTLPGTGTLTLGSTTGGSRLVGQLQELRLWSSSLQDSAFNNHVKAPAAYDANSDAYDELLFRLPLTQKIDHSVTSSLVGVQPASNNISASFADWTNNTPYDSIEEIYYYDSISVAAGTYDDNKIRIESNELIGTLDVKTRAERSQYDKAPLDSKRLGVYFSPQTMIDEDIIAQLGFTELDSYIGDPSQTYERSYPDLIKAANSYWKKYETKPDINSYIRIFSLFDLSFFTQLEQLLPARAEKITGLMIQPNILERSKDSFLPRVSRENASYDANVNANDTTIISSTYSLLEGSIQSITQLSGLDDGNLTAFLTSSDAKKYNGTTYAYDYAIWNGTEYIAGSTPYWESQGVITPLLSSSLSDIKLTVDLLSAQVQDDIGTGLENSRYNGSKMTSQGFNISSPDTIDGGPVVETREANPNQLIYQTQNQNGNFIISGQ